MSKKIKIEIKDRYTGSLIFEYESVCNSIKKTVEKAVEAKSTLQGADLRDANLRSANLRGANLRSANLRSANLRSANLWGADLRDANLRGADLRGADLRSANLWSADLQRANLQNANLWGADLQYANLWGANNIPAHYTEQCSQNILWVLSHQGQSEIADLANKLKKGKVDGTEYMNDNSCGCLIGTLSGGGDTKSVESSIPFYAKGLHNLGEQWFYQIHEGDTPQTSYFSRQALELCNSVLEERYPVILDQNEEVAKEEEEDKVTIKISKDSLDALKDAGIEVVSE